MFKLMRFIRGKALIFVIIAICCVVAAAYFDAEQPTFLNDAISSISFNHWWGDNGNWTWTNIQNGVASTFYAFWPAVIVMAIYAFASLVTGLFGSFFGSVAALYIAKNTRQGLYNKITTFSFNEVDKFSPASLITRLSNDVNQYSINTQMIITMLFRAPVTFIISIINAFTPPMGNVTYGCIILGIVALMLTTVTLLGLRVLPYFTKAQAKLDGTNAIMRENILGARVIKAFNIQNDQHERYQSDNKELKHLRIRGQALMLPIMSIIQFILNAGVIIILIVAGVQFVNSASHPPINAGIFAFVQLIAIVLFSSLIAVMVIVMTTRTMASIKRINAVLDTNTTIFDANITTKMTDNYSVKFDHVKFKYNKSAKCYALDDINFEIKQGQTLGIVGGTGSGKSTIANLIPRFYDVDSGGIYVGGVNIKDASLNEINDNVCVVLQDALLFAGTIESNLKFGKPNATEDEMIEACTHACAWDFIKEYPNKLQTQVEQRGRNFSGGQKQRLSLARTLIKKPNILILDDTTSALDLLTEARVQENLSNYYKNATKIIISQRVSSVKNADKILVIDNGKIIADGTHLELIKSSQEYHQIVESQLGQEGMK